jgi:hypothetical protein
MKDLRTFRLYGAIAALIVVIIVLGAAWWIDREYDAGRAEDRRAAQEKVDDVRKERAEDRADMEALERQVEALGGEPVVDQPDPVPGVRFVPVPGDPGKNGKRGRPGRDAPAPTIAQLAQAVAVYCDARGQCTPPPPKDGKDGEDGRGLESMSCTDDGKWVTHYTDGTSQTHENSSCTTEEVDP